jgi:hypothetical protein
MTTTTPPRRQPPHATGCTWHMECTRTLHVLAVCTAQFTRELSSFRCAYASPTPHSTQIHTAAKEATTREAAEPPAVRACTPARTNVRTKERTKAHTCTETDTHTYRSLQQPQARNRHCYNSCWSAPHMYCLLAPPPPPLLSRSFDGSGIDLQSWLNVANAAESTSPTRHEHGALCADTQLLFCHNVCVRQLNDATWCNVTSVVASFFFVHSTCHLQSLSVYLVARRATLHFAFPAHRLVYIVILVRDHSSFVVCLSACSPRRSLGSCLANVMSTMAFLFLIRSNSKGSWLDHHWRFAGRECV